MQYFHYKKDRLYCESVDIAGIAKKAGTPFYLYSHKAFIDRFMEIKTAFKSLNPLICYSMKSNSNLSVLSSLVDAGAGLDIVSGGELFKAAKVKADPGKIVYAGVGKTPAEIQKAIESDILLFNVESVPELILINDICGRIKKRTRLAIRVNPDVKANTHKYITTGCKENKFGVDEKTLMRIFRQRGDFRHVDITGIHIHIGSQITTAEPFVKAVKKASQMILSLRKKGHRIDYLNIGGGVGIMYKDEKHLTAKAFAESIIPIISGLDVKLILEPGRFISGNSGILVSRVLYMKKASTKNFVVVDAAMNDLMRPSLYNAYHRILPLRRFGKTRKKKRFDIVGPVCESGDFMAKDRLLPDMKGGDLLAVMSAGAYGFSMSSNYNARPRAAEIMVIGKKYYLIRRRETYQDLVQQEQIPAALKHQRHPKSRKDKG
jgi:diaminopimelate decarboxylase